VACGDNFGRVRLYRYPVTSALAKCKEYRGHGAEVRKVRWSAGDSHLLTLAAHDRCVFQWEHVVDDVADEERDAKHGPKPEGDAAAAAADGAAPEEGGQVDGALEAPGVVANEGADAKAAEQLAADIDAADDEDELSDDDADPSEVTSKPWLLESKVGDSFTDGVHVSALTNPP